MEPVEKGKAELISGIESDARIEEQEIIKEAEKRAAEKRKYSEKKIEALLNNAHSEAQRQAEAVKKKILLAVDLELKRHSMSVRSDLIQEIMNRVENKLASMAGDENYRSVLINWIAEAFIGLGAEAAQINASQKERAFIDDQLLSEVKEIIHMQTNQQAQLKLSDAEPLKYQGIVLTAADGRTAFNNQVKTRMLRYQSEIRTLIYNAVLADDRKE
ncbi:MAG: V-type ATP synthase subunit E [Planctomycetota bacterium]|jgi:vacuolar-type H+-ATPase subunit E/Vma4